MFAGNGIFVWALRRDCEVMRRNEIVIERGDKEVVWGGGINREKEMTDIYK